MGRHSSLTKLPKAQRDKLHGLINNGATLEVIILAMEEAYGVKIARSTLGRYSKNVKSIAKKMNESREIARTLATELNNFEENDQTRLLVEMLHNFIFKLLAEYSSADAESLMNSKDFMQLARAMKDLASTQKLNHEQIMKIRADVLREAADTAEDTMSQYGIKKETADRIKQEILGIKVG